MFDKDAIRALQLGAAIQQAHAANPASECAIALPSEFTLHDLEQYAEGRRHARGTFTTPFVAAFCAYVRQHAEAGATAFIDAAKMQASAVLNLGTPGEPGHADNVANLAPTKTAPYAALCNATVMRLSQRDAAEFLEDWQAFIECADDAGPIKTSQAIAAVRRITIESMQRAESSEQSLSAERSALESVAAKSKEPLPTFINFTCKPYAELAERRFTLRLGILTGDKVPSLVLRLVKAEEHAEEMANELAGLVGKGLQGAEPPITAVIGSYAKGR